MRNVLLIAAREFRQVVRTRGFWISLLALPLVLGVMFVGQRLSAPTGGAAYVLIDETGRYGEAVRHRLEINHQRQVMLALAAYEAQWAAEPGEPARERRWYADPEVAGFLAAGGLERRLAQLAPRLAADAPAFSPPQRALVEVSPPALLGEAAGDAAIAERAEAVLGERVATPQGRLRLNTIIHIPQGFGAGPEPVRIFASGAPSAALVETVRGELARRLRAEALASAGLAPAQAAAIEALQAPVVVSRQERAGRVVTTSILPLAAAYLLLMSMMMTGSLLLQGVMEERSNKLLEAVLACVTPGQLMYGKLLGLGFVGLIMITVWGGCGLAATLLVDGPVGPAVREALTTAESPWLVAAVLFYFLAGQVMYASLFLAVGSMSDSMQDAQGYLTPIMLLVLVPFMLLMGQVVRDPDGLLPTVMPWIPLYTPFAMLARMGHGVTPLEAVGTSVLLVAFLALQLWLLGRLFRRVLLRTGQPPKLAEIGRLMMGRAGD